MSQRRVASASLQFDHVLDSRIKKTRHLYEYKLRQLLTGKRVFRSSKVKVELKKCRFGAASYNGYSGSAPAKALSPDAGDQQSPALWSEHLCQCQLRYSNLSLLLETLHLPAVAPRVLQLLEKTKRLTIDDTVSVTVSRDQYSLRVFGRSVDTKQHIR